MPAGYNKHQILGAKKVKYNHIWFIKDTWKMFIGKVCWEKNSLQCAPISVSYVILKAHLQPKFFYLGYGGKEL